MAVPPQVLVAEWEKAITRGICPDMGRTAVRRRRIAGHTGYDGVRIHAGCLMDMVPSGSPKFVMTGHYDRPMGYRINKVGGKPATSGIVAFRKGYEDVRARLGNMDIM